MATVAQAVQIRAEQWAPVEVTTIKAGDTVRYPNRTDTARLSMKVERAVDCGEGVILLIGQGRTLAGARARLRRVATFRMPRQIDVIR
jgi:hypothetical protein